MPGVVTKTWPDLVDTEINGAITIIRRDRPDITIVEPLLGTQAPAPSQEGEIRQAPPPLQEGEVRVYFEVDQNDVGWIVDRPPDYWLGCAAKQNKWDFFVFLWMGIATSFLGAAVGFHRLWTEPIILSSSETWMHFMVTKHPGAVLFMFLDVFLLTGALILTGAQAVQIARSMATNEVANRSRYTYLRGPHGHFRNHDSRGCQRNCTDFLINGYSNDEEVAWPTLQQTVQGR